MQHADLVTNRVINEDMISFENLYQNNVVGIVDVVNSTKIISKISQEQACQYYSVFHNTLAHAIKFHGGSVVKNIGDGILFYFPQFESVNSALACSAKLIELSRAINYILKERKIPQIQYRISLDYGPLMIANYKTSSSKDIFGSTVNLCSKINHFAAPNQIVIGGDLFEIARKSKKYSFKHITQFKSAIKHNYQVYSVNLS
ncbi:MAG: adenylate/guanylate cyclase domain-containing protein [Nitrosopumilus sp.]|nr:adenylate/guanylate cyclase domain-containing protein [Nitrosopumilus sp.]